VRGRLPPLPAPAPRALHLGGRSFTLHAGAEPPGPAPRLCALLQSALPGGGAGAVIVEDGAGAGLGLVGLAAGAPEHAALLGFEPRLHEAALLAYHIGHNDLPHARAFAVALDDPAALLAREGLARLDVLSLAGPGVAARLSAWGPAALARGALVVAEFDLAEALADPGSHPRALLEAWRAMAPHASAFTAAGQAYALDDGAAIGRFLADALARPERGDLLVLSTGAEWRARYGLA